MTLRYFALKEPRPYNLVVAFVLHGGKCPKCDELWYEFGVVSVCFSTAGKNNPSLIDGTKIVKDEPYFFVAFEFTQERKKIFTDLNVNRVPTVAWL